MDIASLNPLVEGHVKIQLFDVSSGKMVMEQEGKNFLSGGVINVLKQLQKYVLAHQHPQRGYISPEAWLAATTQTSGFFHWLVLTDSTMPESPATEAVVPGNIIGYCNRFTHSDTDPRRGVINTAESILTDKRCRWVFDFNQDRANGTINSLCWTFGPTNVYSSSPLPGLIGYDLSFDFHLPGAQHQIVVFYDNFLWGLAPDAQTIRQMDAATGQLLNTFTLSRGMPSAAAVNANWPAFAVRDNFIYYIWQNWWVDDYDGTWNYVNTEIRRFALNTRTETVLGTNSQQSTLAAIWNNIACFFSSSGGQVVVNRYNLQTLSWMSNLAFAASPNSFTNIFFEPGTGHLRGVSGGLLYDINLNTPSVSLVPDSVSVPAGFLFRTATKLKVFVSSVSYQYPGTTSRTTFNFVYNLNSISRRYALLARKLLATPVIKTNVRVMKIIYDFNFD